jgi:hypothetical protein
MIVDEESEVYPTTFDTKISSLVVYLEADTIEMVIWM